MLEVLLYTQSTDYIYHALSGGRSEICHAYDLCLKAQQSTIAKVKAGIGEGKLEETLHVALKDAGHEEHIFGPPIHSVGIEFEESPLPPVHAFFHGEKEPRPLEGNTVIAAGRYLMKCPHQVFTM